MIILGINSAYHEPAAALLIDGELVAAVEEERLNRVKHGKQSRPDNADDLPWLAIQSCLAQARLGLRDVDAIGYSFQPWARREVSWIDQRWAKPGDFGTPEGEEAFFRSNLRAQTNLLDRMPQATFHFLPHHACHAASTYLTSPYGAAGILVVDGIGESTSVLAASGSRNSMQSLFVVEHPHSLGFLWEKTCEFLGFDRYDGPGKVMALGTQNGCVGAQSGIDYHERFASFVTTCPGGTFEIDPDALRYRAPGFGALEYVLGPRDRILQVPTERGAVAAALQRITESVIVHIADELWNRINKNKQVPVDALCMAGGVALNCAANAAIAMRTPWRRIWIQPAAHDAGTALGAALFVWHEVLAHAERVRFETAFLGPEYSDKECRAAALAAGLCYRSVRNLPGEAAKMAAQGRVIGWFQGRMEFGPRALGSRSILADPRRAGIRSILNAKIKEREPFRPFAPTVSAEHVSRFFSAPAGCNGGAVSALEYMLLAIPAKIAAVQLLPSVVHSNNATGEASGRVHALFPGRNPRYEEFLAAFHEESGVPVVLNTSFNVQEPIVCTPDDACKTFLNSGMDALVLGSYLLEKDR